MAAGLARVPPLSLERDLPATCSILAGNLEHVTKLTPTHDNSSRSVYSGRLESIKYWKAPTQSHFHDHAFNALSPRQEPCPLHVNLLAQLRLAGSMQAQEQVNEYLENSLVNKLFGSKIPNACKSSPCILGIDEAGRGPVLGPMSYAIAYYPRQKEDILARMKFNDSKELSESTREKLFEAIQVDKDGFQDLGYKIKIIAPNMISNSMFRRKKYNLNSLSHDTAIDLIKSVEAEGIVIDQVYVDTVGPAESYKRKLESFFPKYKFTVAEKADSKYPIVSAASICAKVTRDRIVKNWKYPECESLHLDAFELGSGYPADPGTKKFLQDSVDPVFGFPTLARFSWSTITKVLDDRGCKCDFNEPDDKKTIDPKQVTKQAAFMTSFFKAKATKRNGDAKATVTKTNSIASPSKPSDQTNAVPYFKDRSLQRVKLRV